MLSKPKRRYGFSVATAGASLIAASAAIADAPAPALSDQPAIPVRALIGAADLSTTAGTPIARLGPADADWSDLGPPIDLPLMNAARQRRAGSVARGGDDLTCLTQAVYYESRSEPLAGQQGVAQVVMNRSHSALYPTSVCDVVFQRSGGGTCQFTFACDGSMDRVIETAAWTRAQAVANQALHGFTYEPLKDAIHYHAAWMTPYWSYSLPRIRQVGGQIFYR
jgi:hypothetical protein